MSTKMQINKNIMHVLLLAAVMLSLLNMMRTVDSKTLAEQCTGSFQRVQDCLGYATGKADVPTKDCCTSVGEIRDSEPECLCYVILMTHNTSNQMVKSMAIREDRLLLLSSACHLVNASVSNCPKLLNIPESSPQYKIFVNNETNAPISDILNQKKPVGDNASNGFKQHGPAYQLVSLVMSVAIFVLLSEAFSPLFN